MIKRYVVEHSCENHVSFIHENFQLYGSPERDTHFDMLKN